MNKIGVLITNLGTPDAPTKKALRKYLKEFLSDKRVVEPPPARWLWWFILNGIILNIRPKKSAQAYKTVWGKFGDGSPLLDISLSQRDKLRQNLGENYQVELGMRYGNPSIQSALEKLKNCKKIIILPLYPQYSASTTGSTFDEVSKVLQTFRVVPEIHFINNYCDHPLYIKALAKTTNLADDEMLILSYHGIPKRYADNGDIYPQHCEKTTKLLAEKLGITNYKMTYQSRFGSEEWLTPYTDKTLQQLPKQGVKKVKVICPGFSADCLETLEEIQEENKEYFLTAGGKSFEYIPALNDNQEHIDLLSDIIKNNLIFSK
jgi:ferrochelatase